MENDDLTIVLEAILDDEKSLTNLTSQLDQLLKKLKNYRIAVSAGLDTTEAKAQLKSDLDKLDVGDLAVSAHLDKTESKKRIASDLKSIGAQKINITPNLNMEALRKQLNDVRLNIDTSSTAERLNQIGTALDGINKRSAATVASVTLLHRAVSMLERSARKMVTTSAALDKELTDLRMVTGESYVEVSRLVDGYNRLAREIGATTQQVLAASSEWLRQGKSVAETQELIRQSMILSKVGTMDAATATQRLTSAMKGYGLEVNDVSGVVDKLTSLDMAAAVSADGLAEALSHTASSASLAGVSLDKILAYITVVGETTQKSASVVGESFKSLFARIQKVTNGEALDDYGENISQVESTLRSLGIELRKSETEFRDVGEVLDEIGGKFNTLDSVVQRQIVTAMGGVYQSENLLALLKNYDKVADYVEISANSAGTAAEKFAAYQESIEAHMNTLTASAEALAKHTVPTELINGLLDAGTAVLDFANAANLLQVALSGLGTAFALKGLVTLGGNIKDAYANVTRLSQAFAALDAAAGVDLHTDEFAALLTATKGLDAAQLHLIVSSKALTAEQRMALLTANGMTEQEATQTLATLGLATAEGAAAGATMSLSGAFHALTAAMAANPIGLIAVAVSAVVGLVSAIDGAKRKAEEARREILDAADAAADTSDKIGDLATSYLGLAEAVKSNEDASGDYLTAKNSLLDALGLEQGALDKLIEQYGDLGSAMRQASIDKLKEQAIDLAAGVTAARDALIDAAKSDWTGSDINTVDIAYSTDKSTANAAALGAIRHAGFEYDLSSLNRLSLLGDGYDLSTTEGIVKSYERLRDVLSAIREEVGADNDVYEALYAQYKELGTAVSQYTDSLSAANNNLIQTQMLERLQSNAIPQTREAFDTFRQGLIDAVDASGGFIGSADGVASAVDDLLSREMSFVAFYGRAANGARSAASGMDDLTDAEKRLKEQTDALSKAIESLTKFDSMARTLDELAERGTDAIPLDTLKDFIELIPDAAGKITKTAEAQELLRDKIAETEREARDAYAQMLISNQDYISGVVSGNESLLSSLQRCYGIDKTRFQQLADGKLKIEQALISELSDLWARYSRYTTNQLESQLYELNYLSPDPDMIRINELQSIIALRRSLESDLAGMVNNRSSLSGSSKSGSNSAKKDTDEYIAEIDRFREAVKRLEDTQEEAAALEGRLGREEDLRRQIKLQSQLIDVYGKEQGALHDLNEERRKAIAEGVDKLTKLGFEVEYDPKSNELFIKNLEHLNELATTDLTKYETMADMSTNIVGKYSNATDATNGLIKDTEGIIENITEFNEANKEGSSSWWDLKDGIHSAKQAIIDDLKQIAKNAHDAVDEIQNVYDTLHAAADEYAANDGFLTIETYQSILDLNKQYMQYLHDENGWLVINEENIQKVIAARTEQLALEEALTYVERLRQALEADSIEDLNNLLFATTDATNATWGLVYANLALLDLTDDQYEAALHNINAIRDLADAAIQGIGKESGAFSESLQNMKDGLDDILKYVMDMLKQRVNDQIQAIEDMKDAYGEVIDQRKEALRLAKEESGYQKTMAQRMKELAKLRARYDALSLDDSRASQAERASIAEEMAKLQDEINEAQADRMVDKTEDALDEMQKAYESEKDAEIKELQDSISSTEKLYRMAMDYLENEIGGDYEKLKNQLIDWNYEVGNSLQSEIEEAVDNAIAALERFGGSYQDAISGVKAEIESASGDSGINLTVGQSGMRAGEERAEEAGAGIVQQMKANSDAWHSASAERRVELENENDRLHRRLESIVGGDIERINGTWYWNGKPLYPQFGIYHSGGVVGGGSAKEDEQLALLKKHEWVLDEAMTDNLSEQIERIGKLQSAIGALPSYARTMDFAGAMKSGGSVNSVANTNNQPIQIQIGETKIYGANTDTVQQHITVTRDMVNQIARMLRKTM